MIDEPVVETDQTRLYRSEEGCETTIMALLEALMVHSMVVQGTSDKNHYGAASVGAPDDDDVEVCHRMGERLAELVKKLNP